MTDQIFYSVMNELTALFSNNEENFDSCHAYCFNTWGSGLGHFYFTAFTDMKKHIPKQEHAHILNKAGNITTCLDCDLWERETQ